MPLFNFECETCGNIIEKFQHKERDIEIICERCAGTVWRRIIGIVGTKVRLNATDTYNEKIKPEVDRITKKIYDGDDKTFLDICGEE